VPQQTLRSSLKKLHDQLSSAHALDAETRALLREVAQDIESVLASAEPDSGSLKERVDEAAVRFEASHPQLAHTLGEITDALAKLGV
jgi:hypothetical protein